MKTNPDQDHSSKIDGFLSRDVTIPDILQQHQFHWRRENPDVLAAGRLEKDFESEGIRSCRNMEKFRRLSGGARSGH